MEALSALLAYLINMSLGISIFLSIYVVRKIGKGILNVAVIPLSLGIVTIGLASLFIFLNESGVYNLTSLSMHIWWHLIEVMGFISIIYGGWRISSMNSSGVPRSFDSKDKVVLGIIGFVVISIFFIASKLEGILSLIPPDSSIDTLGLHHLFAILFAFAAGFYLNHIRKQAGSFMVSAPLVAGFLFLLGGQHAWELITESLKIITLEEEIIELVEQFFVLPALILFLASQFKLLKVMRG